MSDIEETSDPLLTGFTTDASRRAGQELCALLGVSTLTVTSLLSRAELSLGRDRVSAALDLAGGGAMELRWDTAAGVVALALATDLLGDGWLAQPARWAPDVGCRSMPGDDVWDGASVDDVLFHRVAPQAPRRANLLSLAGSVGADLVAGEHFGYVDLMRGVLWEPDLVPPGAAVGQSFPFAYDCAARIWGTVERTGRGRLAVHLDTATCQYSGPANADWCVRTVWRSDPDVVPSSNWQRVSA